ncbi:hypothetical protein NI17_020190 [Thermobifida halotolerans]|uniref:Uncharacterized protein n=1 Tax=Thermobifida halotolerans TaxID=483545 RepID=A0A399FTK7_9ACTN|nr:hypothetical protein [Thermobifida halotolerans]UOE19052.1 hypothetical protein NI17_020190 [Thermobifida halotolerans]
MGNEAGANPQEAASKGEAAEEMANAMAGLADTFEDLITEVRDAASIYVHNGYSRFRDDHYDSIKKVQDHGMTLANNIQAGAGEAALTDLDASGGYQGAWPSLSRDINGSAGTPYRPY